METKPLLFGLIGFFLGGLVVSIAATYITPNEHSSSSMTSSMQASAENLSKKTNDDFDKAFIEEMILHHEGAITMARLSEKNAKHDEIKQLSKDIILAQQREINEMKQWQMNWGYSKSNEMIRDDHSM